MPKEEKSSFSHFFREDAKLVADVLNEEERQDAEEISSKHVELPFIKHANSFSEDLLKEEWRKLRSFFRQGSQENLLPSDFKPAILAPYLAEGLTAGDFPIWIAEEPGSLGTCVPLYALLMKAVEVLQLDAQTSILVKNLDGIIHLSHLFLQENEPGPIQSVLDQVLDQLDTQLDVAGSDGEAFKKELKSLQQTLPDHGMLLPFGPETSYHLLSAAIRHCSMEARKDLGNEILTLKSKLRDLLLVEAEKGPESHDPAKMQDALGFADSIVKFEELASLVPTEGSEQMEASRTTRISEVAASLDEAELLLDFRASVLVDSSLYENKEVLWQKIFDKVEINVLPETDGLNHLHTLFEDSIAPYENLFKAKRIAELELEHKYQPDIHDDYFTHFSWLNFSDEELRQSNYFILIVDDVHLFGADFAELSDILSKNFPLKIMAVKRHDSHGHNLVDGQEVPSLHAQVELGALMMSYKNIYIAQSSSINPLYLFNQFREGLEAFAPAFIYLLDVAAEAGHDFYLHTSAAIESRDFPTFTFRGLLGTPWGSRFEIEQNPQPDAAWPLHHLEIASDHDEHKALDLPFTFAEWAALNPVYHQHFLPVVGEAWTDELISLDAYLKLPSGSAVGKIPFIWLMDAKSQLHKVAVSWSVVIATQERLDFWHFLQENSGIDNYHVSAAIAELKASMLKEHTAEIEQLKNEHRQEIEQIKRDEAGKAMENLASILLDLDASNISLTGAPKPVPIEKSELEVSTESISTGQDESESAPPPVDNDLVIEPYIDTALCTSCNECINKNKAMFHYNGDKMAYIADPNAGTYQQLVEAAEICPVAIIHPGTPLNPHEPDLESLIERAAKFN